MKNRIEILKQFMEEEPQDPFNYYALATELLKTNKSESRQLFEFLIKNHADYLPTYYHLGALYVEMEETDLAIRVYLSGIQLADKLKNEKTLKELKGAYQMLMDELED